MTQVYLSYLVYVIIMNLMYYVMQYYIICIICLHPIQSRRCITIIALQPQPDQPAAAIHHFVRRGCARRVWLGCASAALLAGPAVETGCWSGLSSAAEAARDPNTGPHLQVQA